MTTRRQRASRVPTIRVCAFSQIGAVNAFKKIAKAGNISGEMGIAELAEDAVLFTPILIYGL